MKRLENKKAESKSSDESRLANDFHKCLKSLDLMKNFVTIPMGSDQDRDKKISQVWQEAGS